MRRFLRFFTTLCFVLFLFAAPVFAVDGLEVHFIDVGQADACLIKCDDHFMLIDGGTQSSSQLIYAYLQKQKVTRLDYIVATHDDADHVGGLPAAVVYTKGNIGTVFAPYTDSTKARFVTFKKKLTEFGKTITVPKAGSTYTLGSAKFQILAGAGSRSNESVVLRLQYGGHSFLFMGDADEEEEKEILASGYPVESTVLKVGHHGSDTSTCYRFLKEAYPAYAVISVGEGNSYGHPTDTVLSRLRDEGAAVYRTDLNGTIIFSSNGKTLTVKTEKEAPQEPEPAPPGSADATYVLNTNTHKFHLPGCSSVGEMKEKNKKTVTDTRENIISQGYVPCKRCNP